MAQYVFAADLGGTKLAAAKVDRNGRILARRSVAVDCTSPPAPLRQIRALAADLAEGRPVKSVFSAAAIAVPGLVRRDGTVWAPNLPGWSRMPLARRLKLGIPTVVESDRNAAVLGETWRGAARGKSDVIVLMVGTGIGAGIVSGGRLVRGAHELSGCAGWLAVSGANSSEAARVGELESLCAGPAVARAARRALAAGKRSVLRKLKRSQITAQDVASAARDGDRLARQIFADAGRALGLGVANLVSLFDPQMIVLAGGMSEAADLYLKPLRQAMLERAQPLAGKQVRIAVSRRGGDAHLLGCAYLACQTNPLSPGSVDLSV